VGLARACASSGDVGRADGKVECFVRTRLLLYLDFRIEDKRRERDGKGTGIKGRNR
jgi:hypothetical protein